MQKLTVHNISGKQSESLELPENIFGGHVNEALLHQAVVMYRASLRQGTVATKERADVRGGGRKPYRQKGTGQSRAGSTRSPLWQGGGVTFGPHPRDFGYSIPKKIKKSALRASLNAKFQSKELYCIDDIKEKFSKTKEFAKILSNLKLKGKTLALLDESDASIKRVSRNIPYFNSMRSDDVNAYDILRTKNLLVTKSAVKNLLKRLKA